MFYEQMYGESDESSADRAYEREIGQIRKYAGFSRDRRENEILHDIVQHRARHADGYRAYCGKNRFYEQGGQSDGCGSRRNAVNDRRRRSDYECRKQRAADYDGERFRGTVNDQREKRKNIGETEFRARHDKRRKLHLYRKHRERERRKQRHGAKPAHSACFSLVFAVALFHLIYNTTTQKKSI